jgi:hypothetical protein
MPKQAVRTLIQLRKSLDTLEADLAENRRQTGVASVTAVAQLGSNVGDERLVKFAGETWRVVHRIDGLHVLPQAVDDDI